MYTGSLPSKPPAVNVWTVKINLEYSSVEPNPAFSGSDQALIMSTGVIAVSEIIRSHLITLTNSALC